MNTLIVLIAATGAWPAMVEPVSTERLNSPKESSDQEWTSVDIAGTTIKLPSVEPSEYARTAPANYKIAMPTKRVAKWCPQFPQWRHGYSCGMSKSVEDLLNHLQTEHAVSLERANDLGRGKWQDLHDDLHYAESPKEKSGCANGNCPTGNCGTYSVKSRGFF